MEIVFGVLAIVALAFQPTGNVSEVSLDCPENTTPAEVCVFTQNARIVAINPTTEPVRVVIQIQRIENVELIYRYPFVEELPPHSSRTLIKYRVVKNNMPYALDYDWGWAKR